MDETTVSDLVPIEQKEVDFYRDEVTAVLIKDHVYASVTNLCDALGLDGQGQRRRMNWHSVLSKGLMVAKVSTIQRLRDCIGWLNEWRENLESGVF